MSDMSTDTETPVGNVAETLSEPGRDDSATLAERVVQAYEQARPLTIQGHGNKRFLAEPVDDTGHEVLDVTAHCGIVSHDPGELVLTARAGTPLADIEATLAAAGQRLAFEPPHYGPNATLGGAIAAGVSGPARPYTGAARDFVLGCRVINGRGEILRFGGEVMKNVAGYDLSRLMTGAHGTLGVLLDISLKVLPVPRTVHTRVFEHNSEQALSAFCGWAAQPLPLAGAYWEDGKTYLRLAGATTAVDAACERLGGEILAESETFWADVREHKRVLFTDPDTPLWRLSVPPAARLVDIPGRLALDWGGAQRWLATGAPARAVRDAATAFGGHATVYRGDITPRQHPLPRALLAVHRRLKTAMDPAGILNPGRLFSES